MTNHVIASARKSKGQYKPIVLFPCGRTLVVEQSPERFGRNTRTGYIEGQRFARGVTYASREEAIEAAEKYIAWQLAEAIAHRDRKTIPRVQDQANVILWGGK